MNNRFKRNMSTDPDSLERLRNANKLIVTPCKNLPGQRSICYDDRFILDAAVEFEGVIISNDNFSDLLEEREGKRFENIRFEMLQLAKSFSNSSI